MKLAKILFVLSILTATSAEASPWSVGALAGMDVASTKNSWTEGTLAATHGFTGGATSLYKFTDTFALQMEAIYTQKGYLNRPLGTTYNYNYLAIPMLAHLNIPNIHHAYLLVGPEFDIRLSSSSQTGGASTTINTIPSLDASLDFGVGAETMLCKNFSGFVEARVTFGLTNLAPQTTSSQKNRAWDFLVGSRFSL